MRLDFTTLFKSAFRVRNLDTKAEYMAVQMTASFESPCPDNCLVRPVVREVEDKTMVFDPATNTMVEKFVKRNVPGTELVINEAEGHYRGGNIRGRKGDYILTDGEAFFVVPDKDASGIRVFDKKFVKL